METKPPYRPIQHATRWQATRANTKARRGRAIYRFTSMTVSGPDRVKTRLPPIIPQYPVTARAAAMRIFPTRSFRSNRIACRRDGKAFSHGLGHQDTFLRPRLSARFRFSQGTLAVTRAMGETRRFLTFTELKFSTESRRSMQFRSPRGSLGCRDLRCRASGRIIGFVENPFGSPYPSGGGRPS